jgi:2-haloacid dehalogenase
MSAPAPPRAVVFDLGGVLIDWNPRHLYRKLFAGDEAGMEWFLANVCHNEWNLRQDAGRSFDVAVLEAEGRHPEHSAMIRAFRDRWPEMMAGAIAGTVDILETLHAAGTPLYALTNWSAETFPIGRRRFDFLDRCFRHVVVSGEIGLVKPDPAIFRHLEAACGVTPSETVFIDDSATNAAAAAKLGYRAIRFESAEQLRAELSHCGLPV